MVRFLAGECGIGHALAANPAAQIVYVDRSEPT
jgi:hypothetical protein